MQPGTRGAPGELAGEPNREARERCAPVYRAYMAKAQELVREARDSLLRLEALPDEARAMDTECEARLRELGLTGFHEMQTADGRRFRVPEYFAAVAGALKDSLITGCAGCA
jgi:hypothetical protein